MKSWNWFVLAVSLALSTGSETDVTLLVKNGKATINIDEDDIQLRLYHHGELIYNENIGESMQISGAAEWAMSDNQLQCSWENGLKLKITGVLDDFPGVLVQWTAPRSANSVSEGFDLGPYNWYGGSEMFIQPWPIQTLSFLETPFVPNTNGGVVERYFLSSQGIAYFVDETVPLFVSLSAHGNATLNFTAEFKEPYRNTDGRELQLNYYIIMGSDLLDAHKHVLDQFLGYPTDIPAEKLFRDPIWSTWDVYNKAVNQVDVLKFAQDILDHGFPIGQLEIDDNWETCYGDETFDPDKFPNPIGMVNSLRLQGIDVTLWVHPFVNIECSNTFQEGDSSKYFVVTYPDNTTGIAQWWTGDAGVIDVTKSEAAQWWFERLDRLRNDIGITSFKFDAGETQYLPKNGSYNSSENLQPAIFCTDYVKFASQFGAQIEVRDGYRSQTLPIFVRILDRDSVWSKENGLQSIITSSLHLGLVGYPFVLPDMIAGNGFRVYPTDELFIRWVQVNAFLPTLQFSFTLWSFGDQVTSISRKMVQLHQNISEVIISAARQSTRDGSPIIRPLWWLSPNDTVAQTVSDEFLVGDVYLVAPIVWAGVTERDIYLPEGKWRDERLQTELLGPAWLRRYQVPLEDIAYFFHL